MTKILLACRPLERETLCKATIKFVLLITVVSSFRDAVELSEAETFRVAVIDEDFDGKGSGWRLARLLRARTQGTQIIILARNKRQSRQYFAHSKYEGLFDWILPFPFPEDQLVGEIQRRLSGSVGDSKA